MINDAEPDDELLAQQVSEVIALSTIYAEEFTMMSEVAMGDRDDEEAVYTHPIRFSIRLNDDAVLTVEYPRDYPDASPHLGARAADGDESLDLLRIVHVVAQEEVGNPCILQCVQAALDYLEDGGGAVAADEATEGDQPPFDLIEALPRPLLCEILESFCDVHDRGRLSMVCKSLRTIIERRAERAIAEMEEDEGLGWERGSMLIDGVSKLEWERDKQLGLELQYLSANEKLWRLQNTTLFRFGKDGWSVRDGRATKSSAHFRTWSREGYKMAAIRSNEPLAEEEHFFLVRIRFHAELPNDGDIFVGLMRDAFIDDPSSWFNITPGGAFGVESGACALPNFVSGENGRQGLPMEVNVGLRIDTSTGSVSYGIPIGAYLGRAFFNSGVVETKIEGEGSLSPLYVGVVSAQTLEQRGTVAEVRVLRCSEAEWFQKVQEPYNYL